MAAGCLDRILVLENDDEFKISEKVRADHDHIWMEKVRRGKAQNFQCR